MASVFLVMLTAAATAQDSTSAEVAAPGMERVPEVSQWIDFEFEYDNKMVVRLQNLVLDGDPVELTTFLSYVCPIRMKNKGITEDGLRRIIMSTGPIRGEVRDEAGGTVYAFSSEQPIDIPNPMLAMYATATIQVANVLVGYQLDRQGKIHDLEGWESHMETSDYRAIKEALYPDNEAFANVLQFSSPPLPPDSDSSWLVERSVRFDQRNDLLLELECAVTNVSDDAVEVMATGMLAAGEEHAGSYDIHSVQTVVMGTVSRADGLPVSTFTETVIRVGFSEQAAAEMAGTNETIMTETQRLTRLVAQ